MMKVVFLILMLLFSGSVKAVDWELTESDNNYEIYYSASLKTSKWEGCPDPNYSWNSGNLSWERVIIDDNGKKKTIKTYKDPIEIIANFQPSSVVLGSNNEVEIEATKRFGPLQDFVWLDNVSGGGTVIFPSTGEHIFLVQDRLNPIPEEIHTTGNNYYEVIGGKTHIHVQGFSGVGMAAGTPGALIGHYKLNDDAASATVLDDTTSHDGTYKDVGGDLNTDTGASTGKTSGALDFDGTDEYVEITDHADFTPALTPFSISAWVYMHNASNFIIASKGVYNTDGEWWFYVSGTDYIRLLVFDESVDNCYLGRAYNTTLTAYQNQWIHVVSTYDGGIVSSGIKIYLNGIRVDDTNNQSNQGSFISAEDLTHAVWIGRYDATYADGLIDNAKFFSTELDQAEIDILYNNGCGTEIPGELNVERSPRSRRRY